MMPNIDLEMTYLFRVKKHLIYEPLEVDII